MRGASSWASVLLPLPENPPIATRRVGRGARKSSVAAKNRRASRLRASRAAGSSIPKAAVTRARIAARRARNMRQGRQCFQLPLDIGAAPQIAVQKKIGVGMQIPLPKIHQDEGEVVERIDGRHRIVELDGVEENRPAVQQNDVAQMHVAMAEANLALPFARPEQRRVPCIGLHELRPQRRDGGGRENILRTGKAVDRIFEPVAKILGRALIAARCALMRGKDDFGEPRDDGKIELAPFGKTVERLCLHRSGADEPPIRRWRPSVPPRLQPTRTAADRLCAEIEVRRVGFD